ncbi:membrane protein [soil metagenome]|jgi:Zn-dependent protease|nr:site-2 protease family protein [Deinococcota bacterium]
MLLNFMQGFYNPTDLAIVAVVMVFALIFHNVVQAYVAQRYGDSSPKYAGYMRFDPQGQLEPIGVLLLFILGFGWPKQVPVNSRNVRGRGREEAVIWYSGPAAYLLIAFVCVLAARIFLVTGSLLLYRSFLLAASVAVLHATINLFPVFPLDGAKAALAWGSRQVRQFVQKISSYGLLGFIVIFLVLSALGITGAIQSFFLNLFEAVVRLVPGL